jgi:hypothetical protein
LQVFELKVEPSDVQHRAISLRRQDAHIQNPLESFIPSDPKNISSPVPIDARSCIMKGSPFTIGESGGVGAVADDDESWKIMSDACIPGSKGLDALHGLESSKLSKLHGCWLFVG